MPASIRYNFDEAKGELRRRLDRAENLAPLMAEIAGIFSAAAEDAFENEADPAGAAWAPLSDRRIAERTKAGKWPGKMLQFNGILAASLQESSGPAFAEVGSGMIYAGVHLFGYGAIPARPYLGLGEVHIADITAAVVAYLAD